MMTDIAWDDVEDEYEREMEALERVRKMLDDAAVLYVLKARAKALAKKIRIRVPVDIHQRVSTVSAFGATEQVL